LFLSLYISTDMKYVYGSKKFVTRVWRACGKVAPLTDIAGIYKLPCGAVLYTDLPLSAEGAVHHG
jgi:hypothetical protein